MELKEYIVSLKRGVDYNQFWNEIENESPDDGFIPARRVDIVNNRDASLRQCHYALTDTEAERLRSDPRVFDVEEPTKFKPMKSATQIGNFAKNTLSGGNYLNWGLRRCISETNPYGLGTTVSGEYTYSLDGTNVDIVIQDTGIETTHPEFTNKDGITRVQQIDWYDASGVLGTMPANHYMDTDGHGTHVAGIAAGKTYGWAKNSNIYSVKVDGLDGGEGGGLPVPDCFDVIIGWHNAKKSAGINRPTIVNMSWGYVEYYYNITAGVYRGTSWVGITRREDYGMTGYNAGWTYIHGARVNYIDVSIQEMIDAGIHVCIAAGNSYIKIATPGTPDYDNYYVGGYFNGNKPNYYHRGASPYDDQAFSVGSVDTTVYDQDTDQKSPFSNSGPGVDIYAPGSDIVSATSTINSWNGQSFEYYADPAYRQVNISGTSMASPQVCGVGALILQMEPTLSPAQLKDKILRASKPAIHSTLLDNDYTNYRSLHGSEQRFLYNPYNKNEVSVIKNGLRANIGP